MDSKIFKVGETTTDVTSTTLQTSTTDGLEMQTRNEIPGLKGHKDVSENGSKPAPGAAQEEKRDRISSFFLSRQNVLQWMRKMALGLICFIGLASTIYVIISLSTNDWPKSRSHTNDSLTEKTTPQTSRITKPFVGVDIPTDRAGVFKSKLGVFEHAAACTDRQICSEIASHIMQQGGSVVDGAISGALCNGVVTMYGLGIGGNTVMNVYIKKDRQAYAIDAGGIAPLAASPEMFQKNMSRSLNGPLSIAVPGELMGYYTAHQRFGKLPWKTLVEPAIRVCKDGFFLAGHNYMSLIIKSGRLNGRKILPDVFYDPKTGEIYPVGTKIRPHKELCDSLKMVAENGPLDFYNGSLAKLVADDLRDMGSIITPYDLALYSADIKDSITMPFGNETMYVLPPISSGTIVASVLSTLHGFNFTKDDLIGKENTARTLHRFAEAFKFAFAKRWELGDSHYNDIREIVKKLTDPEYNAGIRARIKDSSVYSNISDYGANFVGSEDHGTAQMSFLAPNGDAVSMTSTLNDYYGSGEVGKRTGILFNSVMDDFSVSGQPNIYGLPASPNNLIVPRKRAMSSMSPMILVDRNGDARLVVGAAGGSKIITATILVAARVLWFGQTIKEAIDAPRFHHQLIPNSFLYEYNHFDEEVIKLLESFGHHTQSFKDFGSVACGIVRNQNTLCANADYRRQGGVAGF